LHLHSTLKPSLPPLIVDYLDEKEALVPFYSFSPSMDGLSKAATKRKAIPVNREVLVQQLKLQSEKSKYSNALTTEQIERLRSDDVFTITTGHQLCVYGGPMFFIYKILSAIKTCELLKESGIHAVPVYWMASEDHDFQEVNHIFYHTQKVSWDINAKGPVGRLKLDGLDDFKKELNELIGNDPLKADTLTKMGDIFHASKTLAEAIRDFVYWLFANQGIVVIDADKREFKSLFAGVVRQELEASVSFGAVNDSTEKLDELGFGGQVTPREINLFWMQDGYRERIEKINSGFQTADGLNSWSSAELLQQLDENPECFSPNVVLRPVYQEVLLPNLAYIGGPGELSYWLQLKEVFDRYEVFYPAILLRDMAVILDEKSAKRMQQLELNIEDINTPFDELFTFLVRRNGSHEHLVEDKTVDIENRLSDLAEAIGEFDPSLQRSAETEKTRILKRLEVLQKKVLRSDRKNNEVIERRLHEVFQDIKPLNAPQERIECFLRFTNEQQREAFVKSLISEFNLFEQKIKVFD